MYARENMLGFLTDSLSCCFSVTGSLIVFAVTPGSPFSGAELSDALGGGRETGARGSDIVVAYLVTYGLLFTRFRVARGVFVRPKKKMPLSRDEITQKLSLTGFLLPESARSASLFGHNGPLHNVHKFA